MLVFIELVLFGEKRHVDQMFTKSAIFYGLYRQYNDRIIGKIQMPFRTIKKVV